MADQKRERVEEIFGKIVDLSASERQRYLDECLTEVELTGHGHSEEALDRRARASSQTGETR